MSKYCSKKMGMSLYPERLQARGISNSQARMPFIDRWGKHHNTIEDMLKARAPAKAALA